MKTVLYIATKMVVVYLSSSLYTLFIVMHSIFSPYKNAYAL